MDIWHRSLGVTYSKYTDTYNVRNAGNIHMHRNPETLTILLVQVQNFYYFLIFRFSRRKRHNFYYTDCSSSISSQLTDPTNARASRSKTTGLAAPRFESQLASSSLKSQLTAFFKIPKNPSPSLPGMTSFTSPVLFPIQGFYYDIYDCHILPARAWTPALNMCPYPPTKPNGSQPN